jgi:DNA-binding CsgD family transcriptional regulator
MHAEHDNVRAALHVAYRGEQLELGLQAACALWWFWHIHGYWTEARHWLGLFLDQSSTCQLDLRAKVRTAMGRLALDQGDLVQGRQLLEESMALSRQVGDTSGMRAALSNLGWLALYQGDHVRAQQLLEQNLELSRELGHTEAIAYALQHLGLVALEQRDDERALRLLEESSSIMRARSDQRGLAWSLENLGRIAFYRGENQRAGMLFDEALRIFRTLDDRGGIAYLLYDEARAAVEEGRPGQAQSLLGEGLHHFVALGDTRNIALCLDVGAVVATVCGELFRAIRLWGAADALRTSAGMPLPPADRSHDEQYQVMVRERVDEAGFTISWAEGQAMTLEQAIAYTLEPTKTPNIMPPPFVPLLNVLATVVGSPGGLTPRETEVLCLLARGLTYAQIAAALSISTRTVNRHLTTIYTKLDLNSRHAATAWAIAHHLI